jgi:CheY-like chemotaxis protein
VSLEPAREEDHPMTKARGEVLLVDDDANFRAVVGEVLKAEGCSIREAADGREALRLLRHHVPQLILVDLMMPTMNGWDLYAELGRDERLARVPVAIISAIAGMRPHGAQALGKPIRLAPLLALIESTLPAV